MVRTYNTYGGHSTLSLISDFLLIDAPSFGSAVSELTLTFHFPTSGPPRKTLGDLYDRFHARRLTLPKTAFRRSSGKFSIDLASGLVDGSDMKFQRGLMSASLFAAGCRETVAALSLLKTRLTAKDDFLLAAFLSHCQQRETSLPQTDEALNELKGQVQSRRAAIQAAKSPWERLDIDWKDFHPDAKRVLDNTFYWDIANDFAPHGNDTGADVLADYRKWFGRQPSGNSSDFYESLTARWGLPDGDATTRSVLDDAAVAIAFAEMKLRATCSPSIATLAKQAVQRQRQEALLALDWPHREDRLKSLDLIEAKLAGG